MRFSSFFFAGSSRFDVVLPSLDFGLELLEHWTPSGRSCLWNTVGLSGYRYIIITRSRTPCYCWGYSFTKKNYHVSWKGAVDLYIHLTHLSVVRSGLWPEHDVKDLSWDVSGNSGLEANIHNVRCRSTDEPVRAIRRRWFRGKSCRMYHVPYANMYQVVVVQFLRSLGTFIQTMISKVNMEFGLKLGILEWSQTWPQR